MNQLKVLLFSNKEHIPAQGRNCEVKNDVTRSGDLTLEMLPLSRCRPLRGLLGRLVF